MPDGQEATPRPAAQATAQATQPGRGFAGMDFGTGSRGESQRVVPPTVNLTPDVTLPDATVAMPTPPAKKKLSIPVLSGLSAALRTASENRKNNRDTLASLDPNADPAKYQATLDRLQRQRQEAEDKTLKERTTLDVRGGTLESLTPDAQERVRQAQRELRDSQNKELQGMKGLTEAEKASKLAELRDRDKVVVLHGGQDIMVIRGNKNGYEVADDGTVKLTTFTEPLEENGEPVMEDDPRNPGQQRQKKVERPSEVNIAAFTFGEKQLTSPDGKHTSTVSTVDILQKGTNGQADVVKGQQVRPGQNVFSGVAEKTVAMTYRHDRGFGKGADIFVLDIGDESQQVASRIYKTIAAALDNGTTPDGNFKPPYGTSKKLEIAGAGADALQIADRTSGVLKVANITERWQVEGPKTEELVAAVENPPVEVVMNGEDARRFNQLPNEQKISLLAGQRGILPARYDAQRVTFTVVSPDSENLSANVPGLGESTRTRLESMAARALTNTEDLIEGVPTARQVSPSEMAIALLHGTDGFANAAEAMVSANEQVATLRQQVDAEYNNPDNTTGQTRQEIAKRLIQELATSKGKTTLTEPEQQALDRLALTIGGKTDAERLKDVIAMKIGTTDSGAPEEYSDFRAQGIAELMGIHGMTLDEATTIFDGTHPEPVKPLSPAEGVFALVKDIDEGRITSREQLLTLRGEPVYQDPEIQSFIDRQLNERFKSETPTSEIYEKTSDRLMNGDFKSLTEALVEIGGIQDEQTRNRLAKVADLFFRPAGERLRKVLSDVPNIDTARRVIGDQLSLSTDQADALLDQLGITFAPAAPGQ